VIDLYIIYAILAFSLLIVWHELGHFTLAKLNGIKVEEFSLGMGPKLFGIKGKETEYIIKALPIGGYVKMLGENEDSSDKRAFVNKSAKQKLSVVAAGPINNLILAVILFAISISIMGNYIPTISKVVKDSPAMEAGILVGDEIKRAGGEKVTSWTDFLVVMSKNEGESLEIEVLRDGEIKDVTVKPEIAEGEKVERYIIGIAPTAIKPNFIQSIGHGLKETGSTMKQTLGFFGTLFKGKAKMSQVGGPLTIITVTGKVAKAGVPNLILFTAFLSVQLGIFNIIPFPALDGGWIFMLLFEIITGKKLNDDVVGKINYVGFMILMALMVLVTIKDILYPVSI
jgi:regulator of sigma E protease